MQIIFLILCIAVFVIVAPRFFKWLAAIDVAITATYYVGIQILAFIFDAHKFGKNAGMFEENAMHIFFLLWSIPIVMVAGIIFGFAGFFGKSK